MFMFPQNCMNIEDGVENQQILNTVSSPGDDVIQRLVFVQLLMEYDIPPFNA